MKHQFIVIVTILLAIEPIFIAAESPMSRGVSSIAHFEDEMGTLEQELGKFRFNAAASLTTSPSTQREADLDENDDDDEDVAFFAAVTPNSIIKKAKKGGLDWSARVGHSQRIKVAKMDDAALTAATKDMTSKLANIVASPAKTTTGDFPDNVDFESHDSDINEDSLDVDSDDDDGDSIVIMAENVSVLKDKPKKDSSAPAKEGSTAKVPTLLTPYSNDQDEFYGVNDDDEDSYPIEVEYLPANSDEAAIAKAVQNVVRQAGSGTKVKPPKPAKGSFIGFLKKAMARKLASFSKTSKK